MRIFVFFILFCATLIFNPASAHADDWSPYFPIEVPSIISTMFEPAPKPLGAFSVDSNSVTVSGVSSGAHMAIQLQVAFSNQIAGAASVAGGVYWCAEGDSFKGQANCMKGGEQLRVEKYVTKAREYEKKGAIDPLQNLAQRRFYIFASPNDSLVNPVNSTKLNEFLDNFTAAQNIKQVNSPASAHGILTLDKGLPCHSVGLPFILACNYDMAGDILNILYGQLQPRGRAVQDHLHRFDQSEFGDTNAYLYSEGFVYIPEACEKKQNCRLHVALHGCEMSEEFVADQFAAQAGYNEWAESNNIIILYPQASKKMLTNPFACWDWYGYTNENYATKSGPQMVGLMKMISRILNK